jgi:hypothetical protein
MQVQICTHGYCRQSVADSLSLSLHSLTTALTDAPEPTVAEVADALVEWLNAAREVLATDRLTAVDRSDVMNVKISRLQVGSCVSATHAHTCRNWMRNVKCIASHSRQ